MTTYRSRATTRAIHWDGTDEALTAIKEAEPRARVTYDETGNRTLMTPGFGGLHPVSVGDWFYWSLGSWMWCKDKYFRAQYEVPDA